MMIRLHYVTAVLALMMVPAMQSAHAQESGRLQDRMSASDFYNAGLNKLSAQELATLNQWLATHQGTSTASVAASAGAATGADTAEIKSPAKPKFSGKRQAFTAHLVGHFSGWTGKDVITLDNGQKWQQIGDDKPMCNSADNPEVKIKPSLFGNWLIDVPSCNALVHAQRIQ